MLQLQISLSLNSGAELEEGLHFSFMHSPKEKTTQLSYLETEVCSIYPQGTVTGNKTSRDSLRSPTPTRLFILDWFGEPLTPCGQVLLESPRLTSRGPNFGCLTAAELLWFLPSHSHTLQIPSWRLGVL